MNVDNEVQLLVQEIKRLGSPGTDGKISVKFGTLFADDRCANIFEGIWELTWNPEPDSVLAWDQECEGVRLWHRKRRSYHTSPPHTHTHTNDCSHFQNI